MNYPSRILLIDDDEDDGYIFDIALNNLSHHFEFLYYQDSSQALSRLCDTSFNPPDFLFIDWNMPKLDGSHCLKVIREIPGYETVPIIIYSTSNYAELDAEVKQLGASCFFAKPASVKDLSDKLETLFSKTCQNG